MQNRGKFIQSKVFAGALVVVPIAIVGATYNWVINRATALIQPITDLLLGYFSMPELLVDLFVIIMFLFGLFLLGYVVTTTLGGMLWGFIERRFLNKAPIYSIVRDAAHNLGGNGKGYKSVALVRPFGPQSLTYQTGFITEEYVRPGSKIKLYSVFVPTAPNPTSGMVYSLPESELVHVKVSVSDAMKYIIACGAGSKSILSEVGMALDVAAAQLQMQ